MTIKKYDKHLLKCIKAKTRNFGKRSIHDIIKDEELDFKDKVNYIRHRYTYYDGNYEFFHNKNGKANEKKTELNQLIKSIILKQADPGELKKLNRKIYKWHKQKEGKIFEQKAPVISLTYQDIISWEESVLKKEKHTNELTMIEEFLLSRENTYTPEQLLKATYRQVKKSAKAWKNVNEQDMITSNKYLIEFNVRPVAENDNLELRHDQVV